MLKLFFTTLISDFVNLVLKAKLGEQIFKGKVEITKVVDGTTEFRLNFGKSATYKMTVKKI